MENRDIEINQRLMNEFGFEPGYKKRVYMKETGTQCLINGKEMVVPGAIPGRNAIEFDPINSNWLINVLFGFYTDKLCEQGVINDVLAYYTTSSSTPGKIKAVIKTVDDDGSVKEIASKPYKNETSCYADLVCRINGDKNVDMTPYDIDRKKPAQPKQQNKRGGSRK